VEADKNSGGIGDVTAASHAGQREGFDDEAAAVLTQGWK
jgi:hypothetical protein